MKKMKSIKTKYVNSVDEKCRWAFYHATTNPISIRYGRIEGKIPAILYIFETGTNVSELTAKLPKFQRAEVGITEVSLKYAPEIKKPAIKVTFPMEGK